MSDKCFYCESKGRFALYELRDDMTKVWRPTLCDFHEKLIADHNVEFKKAHALKEFKEVQDA